MSTDTEYQPVDRTGNFRGQIIEYHVVAGKERSMSIGLRILITSIWDVETKAWDDTWEQYQQVAEGLINLTKKTGELNEVSGKGLLTSAGWNGMISVWDGSWNPKPVAFTVDENIYQGQTSLKIGFINPFDSTRGGRGEITEEQAKAFDSEYGPAMRALMGNDTRNATPPPATKPEAPAKPSAPAKPAGRKAPAKTPAKALNEDPNAAFQEAANSGDDIPF